MTLAHIDSHVEINQPKGPWSNSFVLSSTYSWPSVARMCRREVPLVREVVTCRPLKQQHGGMKQIWGTGPLHEEPEQEMGRDSINSKFTVLMSAISKTY
jgi:hypothetical protein